MANMIHRTIPPTGPLFVLSLFFAVATQPVPGSDTTTTHSPALQRITWEIGAEVYSFKYVESVMEEEGAFYGLNFDCTWRNWVPERQAESLPDGGPMFGFEGRVAFGQVDYDGALSDGSPLVINNVNDAALETRALFGADWLRTEHMHTVYAGIGYRYLNDDLSVDPAGYDRESNYVYLPLGYRFDAGLDAGWSWAAGIEYDLFLWGSQRSDLSEADRTLPDVDNRQDKGFGYRASFRLLHKQTESVFIIEPFFRFWDIDDSRISLGFFEPANETTEYGIRVIWMF